MRFVPHISLLSVQAIGLAFSVFIVALTYTDSEAIETRLQNFAVSKVEAVATEAWENAQTQTQGDTRAAKLRALAERFGANAEKTEEVRGTIVPAVMAYALSDRCADKCGLAFSVAFLTNTALVSRIAKMRVGESTLQDFIVNKYETTVRGLILDLRLFGAVNALVLALMMGLVVFHQHLNWRFAAFSAALTGYTGWAIYGYFFRQNWAHSILFQDWAGPAYQGSMIFVACLFFDWLFLRGFVTQTAVNAVTSAIATIS